MTQTRRGRPYTKLPKHWLPLVESFPDGKVGLAAALGHIAATTLHRWVMADLHTEDGRRQFPMRARVMVGMLAKERGVPDPTIPPDVVCPLCHGIGYRALLPDERRAMGLRPGEAPTAVQCECRDAQP